jgi:hypothetical protein
MMSSRSIYARLAVFIIRAGLRTLPDRRAKFTQDLRGDTLQIEALRKSCH